MPVLPRVSVAVLAAKGTQGKNRNGALQEMRPNPEVKFENVDSAFMRDCDVSVCSLNFKRIIQFNFGVLFRKGENFGYQVEGGSTTIDNVLPTQFLYDSFSCSGCEPSGLQDPRGLISSHLQAKVPTR